MKINSRFTVFFAEDSRSISKKLLVAPLSRKFIVRNRFPGVFLLLLIRSYPPYWMFAKNILKNWERGVIHGIHVIGFSL